jgi:hypothetical protein
MATSKADRVSWNLLGGGFQTYNPNLARALGSIADAVFVFYVARWTKSSAEEWCFRTELEIEHDTAIPIRTQKVIRERLRTAGFLIEHRKGIPPRMYYRLDMAALMRFLQEVEPDPTPGLVVDEDADLPELSGQNSRNVEAALPELSGRSACSSNNIKKTIERQLPPTPPRGEAITQKTQTTESRIGTRLPDDWTPSPEDVAFARSRGVPEGQVAELAGEFRDYWTSVPGAKGRKLDWSATWRNHVRREERRFKPAGKLTVVRSREEQEQEDRRKAAYMAKWKTI